MNAERDKGSHEQIEAMTLHAVFAGRVTASERERALRESRITYCAVTDCPRGIEEWLALELAPQRPVVLGVCERDAALIMLAEGDGGMSIERIELPAKSRRVRDFPPRLLVIHTTQGPTTIERQYDATVGWFRMGGDPQRHVGYGPASDILIGHDGREAWFTLEGDDYHTTRANWSAGYGHSSVETWGVDEHAISIELAQTSAGERPPQATLDAAVRRCVALCREYAIEPRRIERLDQLRSQPVPSGIVGHEDTENGRLAGKWDPNKRTFPWGWFIAAVQAGVEGEEMAASNAYIVQSGDTLGAISRRFGVPIGRLAEWNAIADVDVIKAGQVLRLTADAPRPVNHALVEAVRLRSNLGIGADQEAQRKIAAARTLLDEAGREVQRSVDLAGALWDRVGRE